jgi:hypothetical protein
VGIVEALVSLAEEMEQKKEYRNLEDLQPTQASTFILVPF